MFELKKQRHKLEQWEKKRDEEIAAARQRNATNDEIHDILFEWDLGIDQATTEFRVLQTRKLISEARKHDLPVPVQPIRGQEKTSDYWEQSEISSNWYLTPEGITYIKKNLREERNAHQEPLYRWLTIGIALLGAISGLAAILGVNIN